MSQESRRVFDDPRLRPFLATRFDVQTYIRNILREGKAEDSCREISASIEDVNAEIKGYISEHKTDLMSGMQDVAALSERYRALAAVTDGLRAGIGRLKGEV